MDDALKQRVLNISMFRFGCCLPPPPVETLATRLLSGVLLPQQKRVKVLVARQLMFFGSLNALSA